MPTAIILAALFFGSLMAKNHRDDHEDKPVSQSIVDFYIDLLPNWMQDAILRFTPRIIIFLGIGFLVFSVHSCYRINSEGNRIRTVTDSLMSSARRKHQETNLLDTALALKPLTVWDLSRPGAIAKDDVSFTSPYRLNIRQDLP